VPGGVACGAPCAQAVGGRVVTAPSDLSVVIELAMLTSDRTPEEDAALARVAAVAGLGDLIGGTHAPPVVTLVTEPVCCHECR